MIAPGDELCGECGARMTMYEPENPPADRRVWIGQCPNCKRIEGKGPEAVKILGSMFPLMPWASVEFPQVKS